MHQNILPHMDKSTHPHTSLHVQPYLWGDVVWSATEGACGHSFCHVLFAHAKVSNLNVSLRVQHHIVQLQIPEEAHRHSKHLWRFDFSLRSSLRRWLLLPILNSSYSYPIYSKQTPVSAARCIYAVWVVQTSYYSPVDDSFKMQEEETNSNLCCIEPAITTHHVKQPFFKTSATHALCSNLDFIQIFSNKMFYKTKINIFLRIDCFCLCQEKIIHYADTSS